MSCYHKYNLLCVAPTSAVDHIHCSNLSQRSRMCKFFNSPHFADLTSNKKEDGLLVLCTLCPPSGVLFCFHGVLITCFVLTPRALLISSTVKMSGYSFKTNAYISPKFISSSFFNSDTDEERKFKRFQILLIKVCEMFFQAAFINRA